MLCFCSTVPLPTSEKSHHPILGTPSTTTTMLCISCDGADPELMPKLPPLPTPLYRNRRRETLLGVSTVLGTIIFCLAVGHAALMPDGLSSTSVRWIILGMLYGESAVAIVCLFGILLVDPGVVQRNVQNCLPIPDEVADRLTDNSTQQEQYEANITEGDRIYCVRCFVWRDHNAQSVGPLTKLLQLRCLDRFIKNRRWRSHHCRTCQRCVLYFDHHCGGLKARVSLALGKIMIDTQILSLLVVFGRCIAGRGLTGNMGFFIGIIAMAQMGWLTTLVSVCLSIIYRTTGSLDSPELNGTLTT